MNLFPNYYSCFYPLYWERKRVLQGETIPDRKNSKGKLIPKLKQTKNKQAKSQVRGVMEN